jgi:hypothetical protein
MIQRNITGADVLKETLALLGISASSFALLVNKDKSLISRYLKGEISVPSEVLKQSMQLLSNSGIDPLDALGIDDEKDYYYHACPAPLNGPIDVFYNQGRNNDFGVGFYLGESLLQSASYTKEGTSSLYLYRFKRSKFTALNRFDFDQRPILDWFLYIAINRKKIDEKVYGELIANFTQELASYDLLKGKIADSFTFQIIEGLFNDVYDFDQAEACSVILALGDQLCLKNADFGKTLSADELYTLDPKVAQFFAAYGEEKRQSHEQSTREVLKRPYDPSKLFSRILKKRYGKR